LFVVVGQCLLLHSYVYVYYYKLSCLGLLLLRFSPPLFRSVAVEDTPGVVKFEEKILSGVFLGSLCDGLRLIFFASLIPVVHSCSNWE
jgi:hypothetical protein